MNWVGFYTLIRRDVERTRRAVVQTLVTPWVSAVLYIFIFGFVVGRSVEFVGDVSYMEFLIPGILSLNVISSAFSNSSFTVYFGRFLRHIQEVLAAPLSHTEMITAFVVGGVLRALMVAVGVLCVAFFFDALVVEHGFLLILYIVAISALFSLVGIAVGLWADDFEQLSVLTTFVITPLSFLGGTFYSIDMLPEKMQHFVVYNPFFYFIDGVRYSMIGQAESNLWVGAIIIIGILGTLATMLHLAFRRGWKLRG